MIGRYVKCHTGRIEMSKKRREALFMGAMIFTNFVIFISRGERMDYISFAIGAAVTSCIISIFNLPED